MNFSICLASRERSTLLMNLLESIQQTTHDLSKVEVVVGIDDCDAESHDAKVHACNRYSFIKFFSRPRSNMLNRDYINAAYDQHSQKGKYAIACNDDVVFKTQNWDKIADEKMEDYLKDKPDRIGYGFLSDSLITRHGFYSCFPMITREGIEALGWILSPLHGSWNADVTISRAYAGVNRICDISEVHLDHISYHAGTRQRDHINRHVEQINNGGVHVPVNDYIRILSEAIARGK